MSIHFFFFYYLHLTSHLRRRNDFYSRAPFSVILCLRNGKEENEEENKRKHDRVDRPRAVYAHFNRSFFVTRDVNDPWQTRAEAGSVPVRLWNPTPLALKPHYTFVEQAGTLDELRGTGSSTPVKRSSSETVAGIRWFPSEASFAWRENKPLANQRFEWCSSFSPERLITQVPV